MAIPFSFFLERLTLGCHRKKNPTLKKKKLEKTVKAGDRVAQLILERIATPVIAEVDDLDDTVRGSGGYGSTGVKS